VFSAIVQGS